MREGQGRHDAAIVAQSDRKGVRFAQLLGARDAGFVVIFSAAAALLLMTVFQTRFLSFAAACVLLFLPLIWEEVKHGVRATRAALRAGTLVTVAVGAVLFTLVQRETLRPLLVDYLAINLCADADTSRLNALPPGRIVASRSLGLQLLDQLPPGMTVNAILFDRAVPGMRRMFDVFISTDAETRKAAAQPFDYLAVCRYLMVDDIPNDAVFAVLTRGGDWPVLVPVSDSPDSRLRLFKIDHAHLQ